MESNIPCDQNVVIAMGCTERLGKRKTFRFFNPGKYSIVTKFTK
jgi:hypothetical protein